MSKLAKSLVAKAALLLRSAQQNWADKDTFDAYINDIALLRDIAHEGNEFDIAVDLTRGIIATGDFRANRLKEKAP